MKKKSALKQKLKNSVGKGRYLTRALRRDDPEELQWMLQDVIRANGGIQSVAKKAGLSELRLRLMLSDMEEAWKLKRLQEVVKALGLELVVIPKGGK